MIYKKDLIKQNGVLQDEVMELKGKLFDMDRDLYEAQQFVRIGDERLEKSCAKVEELLRAKNKSK